ncbi:olfactory receptor 14A16-like [Dugong dugon]
MLMHIESAHSSSAIDENITLTLDPDEEPDGIQVIDQPSREMNNFTSVTMFFLMGFSDLREMQILHAVLFLLIYLAAALGNVLIIILTTKDHRLHTTMYFFLKNLSFLDLCLISITVPKSITNSLANHKTTSFLSCVSQVFFFVLSATEEVFLLKMMSYDRYIAICHPLSPSVLLDVPQLLSLACSYNMVELVVIRLSMVLDFGCFVLIDISYIHIFSTILRMPSREGRYRSFSTCLPHLTVVTLFLFSGIFAYLRPLPKSPSPLDLLVS